MTARNLVLFSVLSASAIFSAGFEKYTPVERRHWAFQARTRPEIPHFSAAADKSWTQNPVDAFVLARLQKEGLRPAPEADRVTLIRRVSFDLTGLPPSPSDIDAFVRDNSPKAWEKLVDRLLASPHYGERWGQHWLDVVRYADTDGFEYDTHRHDAWRYRDYVIHSFNSDKAYSEFIREQLAGDEIDPKNEIMRIAAGFHRLGPLRKNAGNQEVASSRNEVLTEMTNVVGSALLGVTLGCARCHDHKFDPIRHTDYYRMQSFFASTQENDVPLTSPAEQAAWKAKDEAIKAEVKAVQKAMKGLTGDALRAMENKLKELDAKTPDPLPSLFSVANDPSKATPIHVLARGDFQNKGEKVGMRTLGVLLPQDAPELPPDTTTPRTELANWLLNSAHPLTSRVMANRVWQYHFGSGIVGTPNDFGRMGLRPTHPELLDYLANRLVDGGWKLKSLHRIILLSNTYRQSSNSPLAKAALEIDPGNKLLWKFSRRRLDAGELRDAVLTVAGRLNTKAGGPGVIVPVEKDLLSFLYKPSQWAVAADPAEHDRRSVYLLAKRNFHVPFMEVFDSPDLSLSCPRRDASTHAPQALELLNGDFSNHMAEAFADRLAKEAGPDKGKQVELAYRLATGRLPSAKERRIAVAFLDKQPLREFALAIFNLNNLMYVE